MVRVVEPSTGGGAGPSGSVAVSTPVAAWQHVRAVGEDVVAAKRSSRPG
jgi:hypothetical protein